jgi:hypothetical protein
VRQYSHGGAVAAAARVRKRARRTSAIAF